MDTSASVRVRGIYCAACIGKILDALRDLPGTAWVSVSDIHDGQATVNLPGAVPLPAIQRALALAGFQGRRRRPNASRGRGDADPASVVRMPTSLARKSSTP